MPDLTVRNLRIGKHQLDIRFWREGERTAFEVIKGDPKLVERCELASKIALEYYLRSDLAGRRRTRRREPLAFNRDDLIAVANQYDGPSI